jgi:1-deoxy-D-xylulose-5-phosphate reductoisomerase
LLSQIVIVSIVEGRQNQMKKIAILGSTGSIGTQTLSVIAENRDNFIVTALCCGSRVDEMSNQIQNFKPKLAVTALQSDAIQLKKQFPWLETGWGAEGLIQAATWDCDMVVNGLMGIKGLMPTYEAVLAGKDIAFANKETLVAGGEPVMQAVKEKGVQFLPVDSEHSAIFQCLQGNDPAFIKRIILTASGGPFRGYTWEQMGSVTREQALNHPKWTMGPKITIDSATMMNKGLEVLEAKWLFNIPVEQIDILIHPQSIVHSLVEFTDTSVLAQLGLPDMKLPISYALHYPDRVTNTLTPLDLTGMSLTFEKPDLNIFPAIRLAYEAAAAGGTYPAVMNGANEVLVDLFLQGKLEFHRIAEIIQEILDHYDDQYPMTVEGILASDDDIRNQISRQYGETVK